jgi:DNA-binding CsgD family transcriptional regulator
MEPSTADRPAALNDPAAMVLGRDDELRQLSDLVDLAALSGGAIVIEGDAGIGKTALATFAARRAERAGHRVLRTAGLQNSLPTGYDSLHELLHPLLPLAGALPDRQRSALLTAFGQEDGPAPERLLVSLGALGLIEEAASTRPILVSVEDLQWIDRSSAWVINFLGLRLSSARVALVATLRTGADADALPPLGLPRLPVGPLDDEAARSLLGRVGSDLAPLARTRILRESNGNPLALVELPAALREHGISQTALHAALPTTKRLEGAFLDQLVNVPAKSRALLIIAAASDDAAMEDVMAAARSLDIGLDDLEPLETTGLVRVIGNGLRFRHPLLISAVQTSSTASEWARAHRALSNVVPDAARAAWHRAAATVERDETVAAELDRAAATARQRGAQPEAARALQRAATLSPAMADRARRLGLAAETFRAAGLGLQALELLEEVESIAVEPETIAQAAVTRMTASLTVGSPGPTDIAAISAALSKRPEDESRRISVLWVAAMNARGRGLPKQEWRRLTAELESIASDHPLRSIALALLASPQEAAAMRSDLPGLVAGVRDFPLGMLSLAVAAEGVHDLDTALSCWGLSLDAFGAAGAAGDSVQAMRGRASVLLLRGRVQEALADAQYAARMAFDSGQLLMSSMAWATVARASAILGDEAGVEAALRDHRALAGSGPLSMSNADARWATGLIALGRRRYREASIEFTHMAVHATRALWAIADRTEAAVRAGRGDTVRDNVADADHAAKAYESVFLASLVARSKALLATGDEAERQYRLAIREGERAESPIELARAKLLFGTWLRRERRVIEARDQLQEALAEFDRAGTRFLADDAAAELRAAGVVSRPAASASTLASPLTAQELQIAKLAATGLSNKQIADQIYLSHRTVSTHLYRIFPKLGITGRGQLAGALGGAGYDGAAADS